MFDKVMTKLRNIKDKNQQAYDIHDEVLNCKDFGVPQSRPRLFIVGVRRSVKARDFQWPQPTPKVNISSILDPVSIEPADYLSRLPTSPAAIRKVKEQLTLIRSNGGDPLHEDWVFDCDVSEMG